MIRDLILGIKYLININAKTQISMQVKMLTPTVHIDSTNNNNNNVDDNHK